MKVAMIVPYFGKFPNYFQLVLKSCGENKEHYDWLFFTDDKTQYAYPENVRMIYCTFSEIKEMVQRKFDFPIALEKPYKFCDFKPAYGYIFEDYIKGYDFWGHCDIDCIYGKFDDFLGEEAFLNDKILRLGHFTLYRNTKAVNQRFMLPIQGCLRYKEVFSTPESCVFDEENSAGTYTIRDIWKTYGYSEYLKDDIIANTSYKSDIFRLTTQCGEGFQYRKEERMRSLFLWCGGKLLRFYEKDGALVQEEYMYMHLMRRNMKVKVDEEKDIYKIIPNAFENIIFFPKTITEYKKEKWRHFNLQYPSTRIKNLKKKMKKIKRKK